MNEAPSRGAFATTLGTTPNVLSCQPVQLDNSIRRTQQYLFQATAARIMELKLAA